MDVPGGSSTHQVARAGPSRRHVLKAGVLGAALLAMDGAFAHRSSASARFGPLGPPDANGLQLPAGFQSRVVARTTVKVGSTAYKWHGSPDGGRCFPAPNGWVYVSNCERDGGGGVGMVRFNSRGAITD